MSDILRWRYGDTNPVVLPVDSATVIEIGDLVYLDTDDAKPAGSLADAGTEAANQEAFHDQFAGVAMQRSRAGDTTPIRVATTRRVRVRLSVGDVRSRRADRRERERRRQRRSATSKSKASPRPNLAIGRCAKRVNPAGHDGAGRHRQHRVARRPAGDGVA